ncbi:MAG: GbsR/MarR family transcriptional regulator [bacterium]
MYEIQHALIEDFGSAYVKFGYSELMGRVVGLLICQDEPLTIDHICEVLDVTKSPINQICRRLEELNLIRRVRVKGERKYHYQIAQNVFLQAGINVSRLYEDNIQLAENHLHALLKQYSVASTEEEKKKLRIVCERLIRMREFHLRLIESYNRFINEWKIAKSDLPSVEEYVTKMGVKAA